MTTNVIREHKTSKRVLKAIGELCRIGKQAPYFSLTGEEWAGTEIVSCGCLHDTLIGRWPELRSLADLHLSSLDGVPLYSLENGYYWLAGVVDLRERYHGGSGSDGRSPDECLEMLAKHFRITTDEALALARDVGVAYESAQVEPSATHATAKAASLSHLSAWIDQQRPRWKSEADACIALFNLQVSDA